MKSSIRLGRWFGIEVGLHYSWFLIALLIVMSLAAQFQQSHSEWGAGTIWALSILTALLFFAALLAHEMSHAMVARAHGLTTRAITLFALGGLAQIEKEPEDPRTEFWVGIIGPVSSALIGLLSLGLAWAGGWRLGATPGTPLSAMLVWLGYINLMLAAFNMIPGFPLDGGRILRAIIWWSTGSGERATQLRTFGSARSNRCDGSHWHNWSHRRARPGRTARAARCISGHLVERKQLQPRRRCFLQRLKLHLSRE